MVKEFEATQLAKTEKEMEQTLFSVFRPHVDPSSSSDPVRATRVHNWIGCSVSTAAKVWSVLGASLSSLHGSDATMDRLCWALYMLKNYPEEVVGANRVGAADEETFNYWVWLVIEKMSSSVSEVVSCCSVDLACLC
jgi:hypothetical protein